MQRFDLREIVQRQQLHFVVVQLRNNVRTRVTDLGVEIVVEPFAAGTGEQHFVANIECRFWCFGQVHGVLQHLVVLRAFDVVHDLLMNLAATRLVSCRAVVARRDNRA